MRSITLAAAALLAGPLLTSPALAQAGAPPAATAPTNAPAYIQMASSGDLFEIQSSQLAQQISGSAAIKDLAQMIITDHTRLSAELKAAAQSAGIAVPPPALAPHHAQMLAQLRATPAAQFDSLYRQHQLTAHQEALNLHRNYAASGDVAALKAAASRAVPAIEAHLQRVQSLPAGAAAAPTHDHAATPQPTAEQLAGERG